MSLMKALAIWLLLGGYALAQAAPKLESCKPVAERTGPDGCWIIASTSLGRLTDTPVFWTLDVFATRQSAEATRAPNATVVEALGRVWRFTVGDKPDLPKDASRITQIGPLPIKPGQEYTAQYRESIMQPGAVSRTHLHSGPEVFYTESGETCLETPAGRQISKSGHDLVINEGEPMELTATGPDPRRGIVLVLHLSTQPHTTLVTGWKSKGLCAATKTAS